MILWFETHATSLDNEAGLASGWHDVELSSRGREQARELGDRRRDSGLAAVYTSDLRRSLDTATIAFATSVPIVVDRRLRECDYGILTRRPTAEIDARRVNAIHTPFPKGQSYEDVVRQVAAWLHRAFAEHRHETILVIGHRATSYALEHLCRGVPLLDAITAPWTWQPGWRYDVDRVTRATEG